MRTVRVYAACAILVGDATLLQSGRTPIGKDFDAERRERNDVIFGPEIDMTKQRSIAAKAAITAKRLARAQFVFAR